MKRFLTILIALAVFVSANANNLGANCENGTVKQKKAYRYGKKGYFGNASFTFTDFGAFLDGEGWLIDKPHYGVDIINGYSFNPYLDLGVGMPWYFIPLLATGISVNVGFTW